MRSQATLPESPRVQPIPLLIACGLLLVAASGAALPYGFFQLLRLTVTAVAIYVAVATRGTSTLWPWAMGGVALLFNPVFPVSFSRQDWRPIDVAVAVGFLVAAAQLGRSKNST